MIAKHYTRERPSGLDPFYARAFIRGRGEMIGGHKRVYLPDTGPRCLWRGQQSTALDRREGAAEAVWMTGSAAPLCGHNVPDGRVPSVYMPPPTL